VYTRKNCDRELSVKNDGLGAGNDRANPEKKGTCAAPQGQQEAGKKGEEEWGSNTDWADWGLPSKKDGRLRQQTECGEGGKGGNK